MEAPPPKTAAGYLESIRAALAAHDRSVLEPGPVPAAVLLPLFLKNGEYHILFTKRTEHLNHHSGEISFPGGVSHAGDRDAKETALRETWEEVGIVSSDVEILGALDDVLSIHNYAVTPFVATFPPDCVFSVNPREIERLIEVPVSHLLKPEIFRVEDWQWKGRMLPVYFYTYGRDEIWGLTASILKQFLDLVEHETGRYAH